MEAMAREMHAMEMLLILAVFVFWLDSAAIVSGKSACADNSGVSTVIELSRASLSISNNRSVGIEIKLSVFIEGGGDDGMDNDDMDEKLMPGQAVRSMLIQHLFLDTLQ